MKGLLEKLLKTNNWEDENHDGIRSKQRGEDDL